MSDKPKSNLRLFVGGIGFVIIVILAYSGGKGVGKNIAESHNAADAAQEE